MQHKIFPEILEVRYLSPVCQFLWHALIWVRIGFSGGKAETQSTDLSEACGTTQGEKVTAFRPVMKRWSRWESAPGWIGGNQYQIDKTPTTFTPFLLISAIVWSGFLKHVRISLLKWKPGVLFPRSRHTPAKGKNGIFIMHLKTVWASRSLSVMLGSCQSVDHFAQLCFEGGKDFMQIMEMKWNKNATENWVNLCLAVVLWIKTLFLCVFIIFCYAVCSLLFRVYWLNPEVFCCCFLVTPVSFLLDVT